MIDFELRAPAPWDAIALEDFLLHPGGNAVLVFVASHDFARSEFWIGQQEVFRARIRAEKDQAYEKRCAGDWIIQCEKGSGTILYRTRLPIQMPLACLLQQEFTNELNRAVKLEVGVFLFRKAVPLVFRHEIPDRRPLFL